MPSADTAPKPLYAPEEVPSIKAAKRLTKTRTKQLVRAAARDVNDPPPKPGLGECCGSSCDPCVNDLWKEELKAWKERWGLDSDLGTKQDGNGDGIAKKQAVGNGVKEMKRRMPGAFEW